ncbi:ROK family transcriptional regulator [Streptomyces sp. NBS 14/10]|uniref:ROK family transcriptional regulator n=1 Tax=Streptomyces sp. NBS 14/10 TaxID=1945643 RepID=UPI000B7E14F9|nr:ROK family transcriptional regulator [Streptomyces sp. NBS 14/10]KAK1181088.1 ROK family transcriptional regulator [Streptomyces sp. NBS 14/10]
MSQDSEPWNRQRLRSNNERLLLARLRAADGPASRAQLARETGLSKPTVSSALAALEEAGLVREAGRQAPPERGRVAVLYEPDPTAGYVLGLDIGRAWLRVAAADLDGTVVARAEVRNRGRSAAAMADLTVAAARRVIADAGVDPALVAHTVVGVPGVYDPERRRVRYADNLPGWGRAGLLDRMREELGTPLGTSLSVHNDANLAALGEYTFGAGRGSRLFVYVLVGTGLGMGVVADGRLFTGAHGAAGEIGFLPLLPQVGGAERQGLEGAVAAEAVVRAARELGMSGTRSEPLTAKAVFDAARDGVAPALEAVRQEAERLAHVVAAVAAVLDPDLVVLGGGVGHSADLLLRTVELTLQRIGPLRPKVAASALGEDAVLLGAVATGLEAARERVFTRTREGGA